MNEYSELVPQIKTLAVFGINWKCLPKAPLVDSQVTYMLLAYSCTILDAVWGHKRTGKEFSTSVKTGRILRYHKTLGSVVTKTVGKLVASQNSG